MSRSSPRAMLAAIALADAPTPREISFLQTGGTLRLIPYTLCDARAWATFLGAEYGDYLNADGNTYLDISSSSTVWNGWKVRLWCCEKKAAGAAPESLPAKTRAALTEIAKQ